MIGNILAKFEKNLSSGFFFQGNDLKAPRIVSEVLENSLTVLLDT